MTVTQYVGSRYVPIFADPVEWSSTKQYESLTIVLHQGNSYTSKQFVPVGIDIANDTYWAETGNYNAQIEQYRAEVRAASDKADALSLLIPGTSFTPENTVKNYVDEKVASISELLPAEDFTAENNIKSYIDYNMSNIDSDLRNFASQIGNVYHIQCEKVSSFEVPSGVAMQGATASSDYMYFFFAEQGSSPATPFLIKVDANYNIVGRCSFADYPSVGHGNSIAYDSVNDCIVILSSNGYITCVSQNMDVLSHNYLGTNAAAKRFSQIAITENYAILNGSSSNVYYFYKRVSSGMFAMFGIADFPLARGIKNMNQDCFMQQDFFYSMGSTSDSYTYFDAFSANGVYTARFIVDNVTAEMEGCFVFKNYVYFNQAFGDLYRFPIDLIHDSNSQLAHYTPTQKHITTRGLPPATVEGNSWFAEELRKTVHYVKYDSSHYFPVKISNAAVPWFSPYIEESERLLFGGINYWNTAYTSNGAIRVTGIRYRKWFVVANFNVSTLGNYQYLAGFTMVDLDNVQHSVTFTDGESDESIAEKINSVFTACSLPNVTLEMQGRSPLGYIQAHYLPVIV